MKADTTKKLHTYTRGIIQLFFFVFFPAIYTSAFSGIKYVFTTLGTGSEIASSTFLTILIVISVYTIIFGRFFCGYACAFGALGDAVRAIYAFICKKLKKRPLTVKGTAAKVFSFVKHMILFAIVILSFMGIYGSLTGWNPWDVFSMTHAGNFAYGAYRIGVVLMVLILILMAISERGFCKFLCPMGAWFALLPVIPHFAIRRDKTSCIPGCKACITKCPAEIDIPQKGSWRMKGDCFTCGKCIDACPKRHITCGGLTKRTPGKLKGNETIFTVVRAALLLGAMLWAGI